mgnify:CR=1 FL=1
MDEQLKRRTTLLEICCHDMLELLEEIEGHRLWWDEETWGEWEEDVRKVQKELNKLMDEGA